MKEIASSVKPIRHYQKIIYKGNGLEWQDLFDECRENYDVAFAVAKAVACLDPEYRTVQVLWKSAIECLQPGIDIRLGKISEEDLKVRNLKQTKYSD